MNKIIIWILIAVLLVGTGLPVYAQKVLSANLVILDYYPGPGGGKDSVKCYIDSITFGESSENFRKGKVIILPIFKNNIKDFYLFDQFYADIYYESGKFYIQDMQSLEKGDKKIKLPLKLAVGLFTDKNVYNRNESANFKIYLRNDSGKNMEIYLPSSQQYDFQVYNSQGGMVWNWGAGKFFITMIQCMIFAPREEKFLEETWDMSDNQGNKVPPGIYTVRGIISTVPEYPIGEVKIQVK